MELDFIAKGDDFHKVELFLHLINYLFIHRPFPYGLQSARWWKSSYCNVKYDRAKQPIYSLAKSGPDAYVSGTLP